MGQDMSVHARASREYSVRGWPAFMTEAQLRELYYTYKVTRRVGGLVRIHDGRGCIEYLRLGRVTHSARRPGGGPGAQVYYQRVDWPCGQPRPAALAKFPAYLAHSGDVPYNRFDGPPGRAWTTKFETIDVGTNRCATYRQVVSDGRRVWRLESETCPVLRHRHAARRAKMYAGWKAEDARHAAVIAGRRAKGEADSLRAFLQDCAASVGGEACQQLLDVGAAGGRFPDPAGQCDYDDVYYSPACQRALAPMGLDKRARRAEYVRETPPGEQLW